MDPPILTLSFLVIILTIPRRINSIFQYIHSYLDLVTNLGATYTYNSLWVLKIGLAQEKNWVLLG